MENQSKEVLKIVVVGHVDHGKSTMIGRLLYDTKSLPEGAIDKVKRISKETGKPFEYAYLLDAFEEEQKQGITIDTTQIQFFTKKRDYVIIDAPGHKEFLKNMISGAASAEAAILVIDAKEGIKEQSKRHGYILSLLGIDKVYVVVNKMDLIDYNENEFHRIKEEMNTFLNSLNVYPLDYIPVSAFLGENITSQSDRMLWYQGAPVLDALDGIEKSKGLEDKPLRFPIQDIYKFDDRRIIAGRVESGRLKVGDQIVMAPDHKITRVKTIEVFSEKDRTKEVSSGMSVGITVEDEFFNKRGEIISHIEEKPFISDAFRANIFWMGKHNLVPNKKYKLKLATQEVEAELHSIIKIIDATSLENTNVSTEIKRNDVAEVIIRTKGNIAFDEFRNNQAMGRFVIVDGYDVAGGGIISKAEEHVKTKGVFKKYDIEVKTKIFDEVYYDIEKETIEKKSIHDKVYVVGDILPLVGESYSYPDYFDIISFSEHVVVQIRNAKIHDITPLNEYHYEGYPLVNEQGLALKVKTNEDAINALQQYFTSQQNDTLVAYTNKWINFSTYRTLHFNKKIDLEYNL